MLSQSQDLASMHQNPENAVMTTYVLYRTIKAIRAYAHCVQLNCPRKPSSPFPSLSRALPDTVIFCFHGRGRLKAIEIRRDEAQYGKIRSLLDVDDLCEPGHEQCQEMDARRGRDVGRHRQRQRTAEQVAPYGPDRPFWLVDTHKTPTMHSRTSTDLSDCSTGAGG